MKMKVKAGRRYRFEPVVLDLIHNKAPGLKPGDIVEVVNLPGAPKCNTMGQCHVERDGQFMGMVACNSLKPI
jgi:hypothetical protein